LLGRIEKNNENLRLPEYEAGWFRETVAGSTIVCVVHQILLDDRVIEVEMGGACEHGRDEVCIKW
jgi:hypothetical protein